MSHDWRKSDLVSDPTRLRLALTTATERNIAAVYALTY